MILPFNFNRVSIIFMGSLFGICPVPILFDRYGAWHFRDHSGLIYYQAGFFDNYGVWFLSRIMMSRMKNLCVWNKEAC